MAHDRITLIVPAKSGYAKTVRMTAATLASRMSMSYDEVEDVRIAAEEAFVYAVGSTAEDDEVTLRFVTNESSIEIEVDLGRLASFGDEDAERSAEFAAFILDAVCDSHEFVSNEAGSRMLRLTKRAGTIDAD